MKIMTLLIALSLALQLEASDKNANAKIVRPESGPTDLDPVNAATASAASIVVGFDGETDCKRSEADVKTGITQQRAASVQSLEEECNAFSWDIINRRDADRKVVLQRKLAECLPHLSSADAQLIVAIETDMAARNFSRVAEIIQKNRERIIVPRELRSAGKNFEYAYCAQLCLQRAPTVQELESAPEVLKVFNDVATHASESCLHAMPSDWALLVRLQSEYGQTESNWRTASEYPHWNRNHPYKSVVGLNYRDDVKHRLFLQLPLFDRLVVAAVCGHPSVAPFANDFPSRFAERVPPLWKKVGENISSCICRADWAFIITYVALDDHEWYSKLRASTAAALREVLPRELEAIVSAYGDAHRLGIRAAKVRDVTWEEQMIGSLEEGWARKLVVTVDPRGIINEIVIAPRLKLIEDLIGLGEMPGAERVEEIYFTKQLIGFLPSGLCRNLKQLKKLDLSDNPLRLIDSQAFVGADKLIEIDLQHCLLEDLPEAIYQLPKLNKLLIEGNPLSEDAQKKYQAWQERKKQLEVDGVSNAVVHVNANAAALSTKSS